MPCCTWCALWIDGATSLVPRQGLLQATSAALEEALRGLAAARADLATAEERQQEAENVRRPHWEWGRLVVVHWGRGLPWQGLPGLHDRDRGVAQGHGIAMLGSSASTPRSRHVEPTGDEQAEALQRWCAQGDGSSRSGNGRGTARTGACMSLHGDTAGTEITGWAPPAGGVACHVVRVATVLAVPRVLTAFSTAAGMQQSELETALAAATAELAQIRRETDSERVRVKKAITELKRKADRCVCWWGVLWCVARLPPRPADVGEGSFGLCVMEKNTAALGCCASLSPLAALRACRHPPTPSLSGTQCEPRAHPCGGCAVCGARRVGH